MCYQESNHLNYKEPFIGIDSVHIYIKSTTIKNIEIKSPLQWITVQDCTMPSSGKTVNDWSSVRSQNITEAAEILKILIRMDQKEVCSFFNIRTGMKQNGPVGTQVSLIKNIRVNVFVAYAWEKCYKWTLTIWWRQVRTHPYEEQQNGENKRTYLTFWNDAKLSNGSACLNNKTFTLAPLTAYKRTVFFENNGVIIVQLDESCPVPLTEIAVRNSEPYIWTFKNNPL